MEASESEEDRSREIRKMSETEEDRSREIIIWDEELLKVKDTQPGAKYGPIIESIRHKISDSTACSMFCGGKKCKYDTPSLFKEESMAIKGLFSHWVTDNILATSRPTPEAVEKHKCIDQFREQGIKAIINLQLAGEHSFCGSDLHESGFSYNPQEFMDKDVFFYNFGWPDYSVGSLTNILDMVKVMQFAVSEGKVAVHCHAGLGRTGVLIACYLVFANRMEAEEAVHYVRSKRPGAVQTRTQVFCVQEFAKYLQPLRVIFSSTGVPGAYDFNLSQFLIRQKHILHGYEARTLKYIPKLIYVICERLLQLAGKCSTSLDLHHSTFHEVQRSAPNAFNNASSMTLSVTPGLKAVASNPNISQMNGHGSISKSRSMERLDTVEKTPTRKSSDSDSTTLSSPEMISSTNFQNSLGYNGNNMVAEKIAEAMALTDYTEDVTEKVQEYKEILNNKGNWQSLMAEEDPVVLSKLMWDWIDHLKEPVLTPQDMPQMLDFVEQPHVGLNKLDKGAKHTAEYMIKVLCLLEPLSETVELDLLQRILSTLSHQHMAAETTDVTAPQRSTLTKRTTNHGEMANNQTLRLMQFFLRYLTSMMQKIQQTREEIEERESGCPATGESTNSEEDSSVRQHFGGRTSKNSKRTSERNS